jgi:hypothetical protein
MTADEYYDSAASGRHPASDFEWYAIDRHGAIAFLTTAGFGVIPRCVFRSKEDYWRCRRYFQQLPARCDHARHVTENGDLSSWIEMAHRGMFGYDWTDNAGQYITDEPYRLIASPAVPLMIDEVPPNVRAWLEPIRFASLAFAQAELLHPEREFSDIV